MSAPPQIDGVSWRAATRDDIAEIAALQHACFIVDTKTVDRVV